MLTFGDLIQTGAEVVTITGKHVAEFADIVKGCRVRVDHAQDRLIRDSTKISGYRDERQYERLRVDTNRFLGTLAGRAWYAEKEPAIAPVDSFPGDRLTSPFQRELRMRIARDAAGFAGELKGDDKQAFDAAGAKFLERLTEAIEQYDAARTAIIAHLQKQLMDAINRMPGPMPTMAIWLDPMTPVQITESGEEPRGYALGPPLNREQVKSLVGALRASPNLVPETEREVTGAAILGIMNSGDTVLSEYDSLTEEERRRMLAPEFSHEGPDFSHDGPDFSHEEKKGDDK